jgi:hypothetical protein
VIEDIQIKAELARYRFRGFGIPRSRTRATFDDLTFVPLMVAGMSYGALSKNAKAALARGARKAGTSTG